MKHMFDYGMMKKAKGRFVTKADIFLLLGVLLCAFLLFFFFYLRREPGVYAEISYDGTLLGRIVLSEAEEKYYLIGAANAWDAGDISAVSGDSKIAVYELSKEEWTEWSEHVSELAEKKFGDYNIFLCKDGEVRMLGSNCPDKICVHHSAVSAVGENIICLPHRIVIEITGGEEAELDGVVN